MIINQYLHNNLEHELRYIVVHCGSNAFFRNAMAAGLVASSDLLLTALVGSVMARMRMDLVFIVGESSSTDFHGYIFRC